MTIFYFFIFLIITHAQLECINMTMQIFKRERICYLFGTAFERQQHYQSLPNSFRLFVHRNTQHEQQYYYYYCYYYYV